MKNMCIVVIGGIPDYIATEFARTVYSEIEQGRRKVLWSPIPNNHIYSDLYISKLYQKFHKYVCSFITHNQIHGDGPLNTTALLIYVNYPFGNSEKISGAFFPDTLAISVPPPNLADEERPAPNILKKASNIMTDNLKYAIGKGEKALAAIRKELISRDNKTPLLLPISNFCAEKISDLLNGVAVATLNGDPFHGVKSVTRKFENENPRVAVDGDAKRHFANPNGLLFKSPGRSRHGIGQAIEERGHPNSCLIRSRLRLGAPFDPRFHYDCGKARGKLPSTWSSCHQQAYSTPKGRNHINIAPNDHVR